MSAAVRARPVAQRAAFEAQISTKVLRQDSSRSPVHHEGAARKAALSLKIERKRVAMVVERFCGCVFGCLRVDRSPFPMTAIRFPYRRPRQGAGEAAGERDPTTEVSRIVSAIARNDS